MSWFKKKKVKVTKEPVPISNIQSIHHHESRIFNLIDEYEILSEKVSSLELNNEMARSIKNKTADTIVFRMTIIEYEIEIRKGLLNGFIHKLV